MKDIAIMNNDHRDMNVTIFERVDDSLLTNEP